MASGKKGPGAKGGRIITHKITRGRRKGQTVRGYVSKGGKFSEIKTNKAKKSGRGGRSFITTRDKKGRRVHTYVIGGKTKSVTLKKSRKSKSKAASKIGASTRRSLSKDVKRERSRMKKQKPPSKKAAAKGGRKSRPPKKKAKK